jgi:L-fuconolactonase
LRIDSHHHFWKYDPGEYGWIDDTMKANDRAWSETQLQIYFNVVLEAFGAKRCMFGSDGPVCLVACEYARWHRIVSGWVATLTADEQERILGGTAMEAYNL